MKLEWLTVDGESILWDDGMLDASPQFVQNVELLVDAKVRVRSPRYYFAEDVARLDLPFGVLLTVEFLLDLLGVGLVEAPMLFGESDSFLTDNDSLGGGLFEKAMSRSEAGKYAAEQRWKNHAKKVKPVRVLEPKYQTVADRINAGTKSVTDAGFRISILTEIEPYQEAHNAYWTTRHAIIGKARKDGNTQVTDGLYMIDEAFGSRIIPQKIEPENKTQRYVFAIWNGDILAGAVSVRFYKETQRLFLENMGSTQVVKGAGSAMYGAVLKWGKTMGVKEYALQPMETARSFWQTQMGMFWDGANMIYSDGRVGMIGELK